MRVELDAGRLRHLERVVAPEALQDAELGAGNEPSLGVAILHGEEHVVGERDHERLRRDSRQRRGEVAACVARDVRMAPFPALAEQVSCVHRGEVVHEQAPDEIVERREAGLPPRLGAEQLVAEPDGYPRMGVQLEAAGVEGLLGEKNAERVVWRRPCRAGDGGEALDMGGMANGPLVRLLCSHREAHGERQPLEAEPLGDQPVLGPHVVADRDVGEPARRVAGRAREAVAELPRADDEPPVGVEGAPGRDRGLERARRPRVHVRVEDGVVAGRAECPVGLVEQASVLQDSPSLELEVAELEDRVWALLGLAVRAGSHPARRVGPVRLVPGHGQTCVVRTASGSSSAGSSSGPGARRQNSGVGPSTIWRPQRPAPAPLVQGARRA